MQSAVPGGASLAEKYKYKQPIPGSIKPDLNFVRSHSVSPSHFHEALRLQRNTHTNSQPQRKFMRAPGAAFFEMHG